MTLTQAELRTSETIRSRTFAPALANVPSIVVAIMVMGAEPLVLSSFH